MPGRVIGTDQVLCTLSAANLQLMPGYNTIVVALSLNGGAPGTVCQDRIGYTLYDHPYLIATEPQRGSAYGGFPVVINGTGFWQYSLFENIRYANLRCKFGQNIQTHASTLKRDGDRMHCAAGTQRRGGTMVSISLNNADWLLESGSVYFFYEGASPPVLFSAHFAPDATRVIIRFDGQPTNRAGMNGDGRAIRSSTRTLSQS